MNRIERTVTAPYFRACDHPLLMKCSTTELQLHASPKPSRYAVHGQRRSINRSRSEWRFVI
ncbi:MAG: hypothetical protein ACLSIL_16790 [Enterococcus casseliflavus]